MPRDDNDDEEFDRPRRRSRREDDDVDRPRRRSHREDDDDADEPERLKGSNGLATTSLVFGVLSFCTGITFLPGLICGAMGLAKAKKVGTGKGMAIAGILTSLAGMLVSIAVGIGGYFFYLEAEKTRDRMRTQNNFKQAGLGTLNWSSANDHFPKPFLDESAREFPPVPESELKNKLSWRVTLLPFLEQDNLYRRFARSEAWDSSTNKPLSQSVVMSYSDADSPLDPTTRLRCFYGPNTMFEVNRKVYVNDVLDGTSNTILYVEGAEKVTWSQFNEYKYDPNGPLPALGHPKRDTFAAVMVDGSVHQIRKNMSPATLRNLITRNDGLAVGNDW